jgi:hypothetical protein
MMGFINLDDISYSPINGFTTVDLGCEKGNNAYTMIQKAEAPFSKAYIDLFNQIWNDSGRLQVVTEEVIESISNAYKENAPEFLYFVALYNIFNEFLEDISEDELPKRLQALRTRSFGTNSTTSSVMQPWQSSTNWRSTMVASLQTVWAWEKPSPPYRSSSILRAVTEQSWFSAQRNSLRTGILIGRTTSTIHWLKTV